MITHRFLRNSTSDITLHIGFEWNRCLNWSLYIGTY